MELLSQVLKGIDLSNQGYELKAFNCDDPEEVVTQRIPQVCSVKGLDGPSPTVESESAPKQEYTILQLVSLFEYLAIS